ncbi:hypothetical protein ACO1D0_00185 [Bacillus licheniformis]|uniref:hypothetical protein n=1 Tax=Bacillus licheniformis TaxID=1402 RepID=UPI003BF6261F
MSPREELVFGGVYFTNKSMVKKKEPRGLLIFSEILDESNACPNCGNFFWVISFDSLLFLMIFYLLVISCFSFGEEAPYQHFLRIHAVRGVQSQL